MLLPTQLSVIIFFFTTPYKLLLLPFWQASIFINNLFLSMHSAYKNILDENGQWKEWAIMTRALLIHLPNCSIPGGLKMSYLCIPIEKLN